MNNDSNALIDTLKNNFSTLSSKKVTAGFDGFIDTIIRIIKSKQHGKEPEFFTSINEFGQYIISKSSGNCSIEYEVINTKLGGNMPITSNALGNLGVHVNCIGAFGYPQVRTIFNELSSNCKLYSFTEPGMATAYEFKDGKVIFGEAKALNSIGWDELKNIISLETIIGLFKQCALFCLLNWSEIDTSTDVWKGIVNEVLPAYKKEEKQIAFFDLSDCSKRSSESITEMLLLLKTLNKFTKVILSLNRNEARMIYKIVCDENIPNDFKNICTELFTQLEIDMLVFHSSDKSFVFTNDGITEGESFFIKDPLFSTGAGDNFNAGFIAAQLLVLNAKDSLIFANATAAQYIQSGLSPQQEDMLLFLEQNIKA